MRRIGLILLISTGLSATLLAHALDTLPYSTRTRSFDGLGTTVRGDIRTVGMAGASVGLGDSFIAAQQNPAGLALTLFSADAKITSNRVQDALIQGELSSLLVTFNSGIAWAPYPWGFSLGVVAPYTEGKEFAQGLAANSIREVRFSIARNFFSNRFSLGASAIVGQSELIVGSKGYSTFAPGAAVGLQIQFPHRFLFGISATTPMRYAGAPDADSGAITSFFRDTGVPMRGGIGLGWIPNRYFRLGVTAMIYGPQSGGALLRSETDLISENWTAQPHVGASYLWIDYKEFRSVFSAGTYLENPRIIGSSLRPHITAGLEVIPWVLVAATGVDIAPGYLNFLLGFGVDLVRVFEKLELIPERYFPPRGGFLPAIAHLSDEGLPRPLVKNWVQKGPTIDPIKAGMNLPTKVEERAKDFVDSVKGD